jgi:hypothetical protein
MLTFSYTNKFSLSSANGANYATQLHRWIGTEEFEGWDEITPSETLMNEFKKEGKLNNGLYDARLYASVFFQDPYFNDGTGKVVINLLNQRCWQGITQLHLTQAYEISILQEAG